MIECLRNENGDIIAICEYIVINDQCEEKISGNRIFIKNLEVNQNYKGFKTVQRVGKQLIKKHPKVEICDWYRMTKYPNRHMSRVNRQQGLQRTREV